MQVFLFIFSLVLTLLFFLYGFNQYFLLFQAWRYKVPDPPKLPARRPTVAIHLPVYNERYVIRRLVSACAKMAKVYGIDLVRILILDDSDDETAREIDAVVAEYRQQRFQIEAIRRTNRNGYKAGALQSALDKTSEDFIAVFDADFIPPPDFLLRTVPYFSTNDSLGIIQSRWTHLNKKYNLLTRAISHAIDVHFLVDQPGRYVGGYFQNFNGSGGVLRASAIKQAGGWQSDTLAEDLDLSYRMQLLGYHVLYLRDLLCPGEIPPTVPSYRQQQGRWTTGSLQNARKNLPGVLKDRRVETMHQWQAFIHLTSYLINPLMLFSFLSNCLAVLIGFKNSFMPQASAMIALSASLLPGRIFMGAILQHDIWLALSPLIVISSLAPWISMFSTLKFQKLSFFQSLPDFLVLTLLSFGISFNITLDAGRALFTRRNWEFIRTPKYADLQNGNELKRRNYQVSVKTHWIFELLLMLLGLWAIASAVAVNNLSVLILLVPFTIGYGFVFLFSLMQSQGKK